MTSPLSAFIITRDEEARIGRTLSALQGLTDDIVVVDSGSTDATVAIAKSLGARVIHRAWDGYGGQKRFAEQQCRHDWVLNVDADEVVTPELRTEIGRLLEADPPPGAYNIHILTVYPGDGRPRPWPRDVNAVRLYHRAVASFRDHPSYDRVEVSGVEPGHLERLHADPPHLLFAFVNEQARQAQANGHPEQAEMLRALQIQLARQVPQRAIPTVLVDPSAPAESP